MYFVKFVGVRNRQKTFFFAESAILLVSYLLFFWFVESETVCGIGNSLWSPQKSNIRRVL